MSKIWDAFGVKLILVFFLYKECTREVKGAIVGRITEGLYLGGGGEVEELEIR